MKGGGFSTKQIRIIPEARNDPDNIEARAVYCQWAGDIDEKDLVFVDEPGFNLHLRRKRARSRIGEHASVEVPTSGKVVTHALDGLVKLALQVASGGA